MQIKAISHKYGGLRGQTDCLLMMDHNPDRLSPQENGREGVPDPDDDGAFESVIVNGIRMYEDQNKDQTDSEKMRFCDRCDYVNLKIVPTFEIPSDDYTRVGTDLFDQVTKMEMPCGEPQPKVQPLHIGLDAAADRDNVLWRRLLAACAMMGKQYNESTSNHVRDNIYNIMKQIVICAIDYAFEKPPGDGFLRWWHTMFDSYLQVNFDSSLSCYDHLFEKYIHWVLSNPKSMIDPYDAVVKAAINSLKQNEIGKEMLQNWAPEFRKALMAKAEAQRESASSS